MKNSNGIRVAVAAALFAVAAPTAFAAGTTAGSDVSNTATVDYSVGGVDQPDVTSNTVTFKVDRVLNVTVAEVGGASTTVIPGAVAQVLTFTVTNLSNSPADFRLSAAQSGSDDFDATGLLVFVESGATAGYQLAQDTAVFIDELAADASQTVYAVGAIPNTQANGDTADVTLTAIAAQSIVPLTGAYLATPAVLAADAAETGGADVTTFIDTVFGDAAGDADIARDGSHSDTDTYAVETATVAVTKSQSVISDPFNGTTDPKAIPGAVIEYCLDIDNSGGAAASTLVITDAIPANTTFVPGSIRTGVADTDGDLVLTECDTTGGTAEDDDAADADDGPAEAGGDHGATTAGAVTVTVPSIAAGARAKAAFRVTID